MYMLAPLGMTLVPLLVGAAAKDLGFSDSQVGFLAAADLIGLAVASVSAVFWIHKVTWRTAAMVSIAVIVAGNILSTLTTSFELLCLARFVTELGSGGIFSLAMVTLGATRSPDRFFAIGIGMTIALSVAIFLWLPAIIDASGIRIVFLVHGLVALVVLPSMLWLRTGRTRDEHATPTGATTSYIPLFICFAGFACFTITEGGVWSYVERIGDAAGFSSEYVGQVLAMTQVVSFISAMAASALSTRFGRSLPIFFGIAIFVAGLYLLLQPDHSMYMVAACMTQFAWIFVLPYLLLMCVELDPSGHYYVLTVAFKMGGFSAGPAIIALFLGDGGYALVSWVGIGFLMACLVLVAPLAWKLDRRSHTDLGN
jgi:predicted MFS family arabinose efflux permease